jgi:ribosome-associated translation inhibitor RaiA
MDRSTATHRRNPDSGLLQTNERGKNMQIQLNTDANVQGRDSLAAWADKELKDKLARFRDHVTRIEVHLSDASAARVGEADKRCKLEARLAGHQPVAVSHDAAKVADAFHGAVDKLLRKLDAVLGRVRDARGRESIRGESAES